MGRKQKSKLPIFAPNTLPIIPGVPACMVRDENREINARVAQKFNLVQVSPTGWSHRVNRTVENTTVATVQDSRPILLDLFSCAGGAGMGYHRAGFRVIGIDINPQPRYPFEFVQADLQQGIPWDKLAVLGVTRENVAAVHASPPCQKHSWAAKRWINSGQREYPDMIEPTRAWLVELGKPYVIENVIGAPLLNAMTFSGLMFGLKVVRKRLFESNILLMAPPPHKKKGSVSGRDYFTVAGHGGDGGAKLADWQAAMGIDWMNKQELTQSIPPAYTEWIGGHLMQVVKNSDKHALQAPLMRAKNDADSKDGYRVGHSAKNRTVGKIGAGEGRQVVQVDKENVNAG